VKVRYQVLRKMLMYLMEEDDQGWSGV
jgi:hypothetical protein